MSLREQLLRFAPTRWLILQRRKQVKWRKFHADFQRFQSAADDRFPVSWKDRYPCLDDAIPFTPFDSHYIFHPAWAARRLALTRPNEHIDISSTLYFCSIVSAFIPVKFYDYRPAQLGLSNLSSLRADLCALPFPNQSVHSLSCMHVVEHVGLGRYGDPIDPHADILAIGELQRVIAPGGSLLFAVPIGRPRVMFNAHRIYSYSQILTSFPDLTLSQFSLIPDHPRVELIENANPAEADQQSYGCGCFHFRRP